MYNEADLSAPMGMNMQAQKLRQYLIHLVTKEHREKFHAFSTTEILRNDYNWARDMRSKKAFQEMAELPEEELAQEFQYTLKEVAAAHTHTAYDERLKRE
jgi:hypothetical protein